MHSTYPSANISRRQGCIALGILFNMLVTYKVIHTFIKKQHGYLLVVNLMLQLME